MQLDTEDGETFVPPAGVVASPTAEQPSHDNEHGNNSHEADESESRDVEDSDLRA
jgi:sorting nexin-1/2